jgi:eukaryotic-like serine/threonine-protein kinase
MNAGCLDESTVVAFLGGSLPAGERSSIESHLDACSACKELTTWAAADFADRSRPAGREGQPFVGQLPPGSRVDRYQVLGAIGRGGMGEVYAAYHPDLDRRIALKVVNESGAKAPERRARLLREARAIARLSHPNVVTVHDAGTVGDRVYIAMEFVAGETVDEWLRSRARGWRAILDVFVAAGRGLAAAHAAGVVHRDFKPQNVMVGLDGSVRVMDFGLARLALEPVDVPETDAENEQRPRPATVTKTGALVGTLAYMAPEQFRSEPLDARADQFSFCVALYEALYGRRPVLAHLATTNATNQDDQSSSTRASGVPAWLRHTIARGLSPDRDRRFASMDALLAAVTRGQKRVQRRVSSLGIGIAAVLLSLGGWRLASARRVSCAAPKDRLAGAWIAGDEQNPKREAVHRAFTATGRPAAETAWQRVASALDDYVGKWSAMYVQACEATNVRGEQSGEILDLRMSCLGENLDAVRALTDVLVAGDASTTTHAMTAVQDLPQISRCGDLAALRSAVPLPRDEHTARAVRDLRKTLNDVNALDELGNYRAARDKAVSIRAQVEATGYKPLLAELLAAIGAVESDLDPTHAKGILEEAVYTAQACRDDLTAAKAAASLNFLLGDRLGRPPEEAEIWARLAMASLDRMATPQPRIRSWILQNQGLVLVQRGRLERARPLLERALMLKESVLGPDHPDVARSLTAPGAVLNELGHHEQGLRFLDRSVRILFNLDPDSVLLASATMNRAEALCALGKFAEATRDEETAFRIVRLHFKPMHQITAHPFQGLGEVEIARGDPAAAVPLLEEALRIREQSEPYPVLVANTQFALSRALWASGRDRARAQSLAQLARRTYAGHAQPDKERAVTAWLTTHKLARR